MSSEKSSQAELQTQVREDAKVRALSVGGPLCRVAKSIGVNIPQVHQNGIVKDLQGLRGPVCRHAVFHDMQKILPELWIDDVIRVVGASHPLANDRLIVAPSNRKLLAQADHARRTKR